MKRKTIQTQAVLTLLTDANFKNLYSFFCDDTIPLHNFEFRKRLSPDVFTVVSSFMKG